MDCYLLSFLDIGILPYPSQHGKFSPIFFLHWSFYLILPNIGLLEFRPILRNIKIPTLSFETFTLWSYPSKDHNSCPILSNIGILVLSFQALEFWSYPSKHWNSDLSLQTFQFWSHFLNITVSTKSFQRFEFSPYPSKH